MKINKLIIKNKETGLFASVRGTKNWWCNEYPDATEFSTLSSAKRHVNTNKLKSVSIIENYGLENETILWEN